MTNHPQAKRRIASPEENTPKQRFLLKSFAWLCILTSVLWWFAAIMTQDHLFPIKRVTVRGDFTHLSREAVENQVLPFIQAGFFHLDVDAVRQQVLTLPWAGKVRVRRSWPDKLIITITEQNAVARWGNTELLNSEAIVFAPTVRTGTEDLPLLDGPSGHQQPVLQAYQKFTAVIAPLGRQVVNLRLSSRRAWSFQLDNGMQVLLGQKAVDQRLARFVAVYKKVFEGKEPVKLVDLRYPNGMAVN